MKLESWAVLVTAKIKCNEGELQKLVTQQRFKLGSNFRLRSCSPSQAEELPHGKFCDQAGRYGVIKMRTGPRLVLF